MLPPLNPSVKTSKYDIETMIIRNKEFIYLLLILVLTILIRVRLAGMPLERDEGEFAYIGQLILHGIPPFKLAYSMKLPGTACAYAVIMLLFGQTPTGIHLGLMVVNSATTLLVYKVTCRVQDRFCGLWAAAFYAVFSLNPAFLGPMAHATHFVVLFVMAGVLTIQFNESCGKYKLDFLAGLLFGSAFLMKQPAIFFTGFALLWMGYSWFVSKDRKTKMLWVRATWFLVGVIIPFLLISTVLWYMGVFDKYWFWTFRYASKYASVLTLTEGFQMLIARIDEVIIPTLTLWLLSLSGFFSIFYSDDIRKHTFMITVFLVASISAVCPGFYFRPHYFILLLPILAILASLGLFAMRQKFIQKNSKLPLKLIPPIVGIFVICFSLFQDRQFFFIDPPGKACRRIYGPNPFPESVPFAQYIKEHSDPSTRIAVIGSEPQIYFYSQRHSATGYIYTYGLMEPHDFALRMQEEMIREIESNDPQYVIFVGVSTSWLMRPRSNPTIFNWANQYINKHMELIGIAEIISAEKTEFRWGQDALASAPRSQNVVLLFKRLAIER